jgi:rubrerythrin
VHEDVFFYLDLSKGFIKKKDVKSFVGDYIEQKSKMNTEGHFGILIFQEVGNPIFISGQKDSEEIISAIEDNWEDRVKEQSYFENGLFYVFSHIAETVRKKSKFNRVIVLSDTPSDLSDDYQDALFNLVAKIKYFPTFIDIIRISSPDQRFFKDDVKLNILASDTKGGIFYVSSKKELKDVFKKLIKNKQLVDTFTDKPNQLEVDKDTYSYYDHLAKNLILRHGSTKVCFFCQDRICPICMNDKDIPKECPDCGQAYHNHCAVNYAINNNIGIPHVWRCPQCDTLLKVDENEFIKVEEEGSEEISVQDYLSEDSESLGEQSENNANEKLKYSEKKLSEVSLERVSPPSDETFPLYDEEVDLYHETKKVRIGGYFGNVFTVKKVGDKIMYEKGSYSESNEYGTYSQEEKSIQSEVNSTETEKSEKSKYWRPSSDPSEREEEDRKSKIQICPSCGALLGMEENIFCPHCGTKLKKI